MGRMERAPILVFLPLDSHRDNGSWPIGLLVKVGGRAGVDRGEVEQEALTLPLIMPKVELAMRDGDAHLQ